MVLKNGVSLTGNSGSFLVLKNTNLSNNSIENALQFEGEVKATGSNAVSFSSGSNDFLINLFKIDGANVTVENDLKLNDDLEITSGSLVLTGNDIYSAGNWTNNGSVNVGSGTIHFTMDIENENQVVNNGNSALGNILKTGQSPLIIIGDLKFSGDLTVDNASFGTGTLELVGSGNQTVSSNNGLIQVQNLQINKDDSDDLIQLQSPLQVTNQLDLTNGKIDLNGNNLAFSQLNGGSSTSYVITGNSFLQKNNISVGTHLLPMGTSVDYTPVTVSFASGSFVNAVLEANTKSSKISGLSEEQEYFLNRSWNVEATGASNFVYNIQLQYAASDIFGEGDEATIFPVKWSNGVWYKPAGADFANATEMGTSAIDPASKILTWNGLSSFSDFGGVGNAPTPLPVELSRFSVHCEEDNMLVLWSTESEKNSDYFILEQSSDAHNWRKIKEEKAAGNSQSYLEYAVEIPVLELTYLRLIQLDIDGKETVYGPILGSCDISEPSFQTFPNPSGENFGLSINGLKRESKISLTINDLTGKIIDSKTFNEVEGNHLSYWKLNSNPGLYFIVIQQDGKTIKTLQHVRL